MRELSAFGVEAQRWTVVFHRRSKYLLFRLIAMGHFKHVSALAWIPELGQWWVYDVGFRRTSLKVLVDGPNAQAQICAIMDGNATVTVDVADELPWMRLGMFCTTAVSHLIGVRCGALRPDALYRHLIAKGGIASDNALGSPASTSSRSEPRLRTGAGAENPDRCDADPGRERHRGADGALRHEAGARQ